MPYVRISILQAKSGQEDRVRDLLDRLVGFYATQPGYVSGYRLSHADQPGRFGRIGVWQSEQDAIRAAQDMHDLALRSELNPAVVENSHEEWSFEGHVPPKAT